VNAAQYTITVKSGLRPIVHIDRFAVPKNNITFLFGESGIGKSMISRAVYGLLDPDELDVSVNNRNYREYCGDPTVRALREKSFFVFQEPSSHLNSLLKISEQLTEGSLAGSSAQPGILSRLFGTKDPRAQKELLDVYPKPYRPSGGEKQRALLAMAFTKIDAYVRSNSDADTFFVFDEPTGSLDNTYRNLFLSMLLDYFAIKPFTALVITHDYSIISEIVAAYPQLQSRIQFRELRRSKGAHVECFDFSESEYIDWLSEKRSNKNVKPQNNVVCAMKAQFSVFGRSLCIYRDAARTQPADLVIRKGEMVYVKAPSGVGKTTLAKVIMGLYPANSMRMALCGTAFSENTPQKTWAKHIWGRKAGMVFQHADESLNLQATVAETFAGLPGDSRLKNAAALSNTLEDLFDPPISEAFLKKKVGRLSGGQKQRLNLLRTFALNTDLVILDEPLNGLDFKSVRKVLDMLDLKRNQGTALLMISHNEEIFDALVDSTSVYFLAES
jgi:ABC-type glutathione transport system ATPase component